MDALDTGQAASLTRLEVQRDAVVHELPQILVDPSRHVDVGVLTAARDCLDALGNFWASVDFTIDSEVFAGLDPSQAKSGSSFIFDYLLEVAATLRD